MRPADRPYRHHVLIIRPMLYQYRRALFEQLADTLGERGVSLTVAHSEPNSEEAARMDTIELPTVSKRVAGRWLFDNRIFIQDVLGDAMRADLVVVAQENKQLALYPLLALSRLHLKKVAFWGHGYNHQATSPSMSEWLKRRLLTRVNWWFSYTEGVSQYLVDHHVDPTTITTLYNTIDVDELTRALAALDPAAVHDRRRTIGIAEDAVVGLFCGALYDLKDLRFLIEAADSIHHIEPRFELVIVGAGPQRAMVEAAARKYPFVHYVGPCFGPERAIYFAMSELFLIPGLVGLAIVDAFASGLPVVTTDVPTHGPEIEYLRPNENGLLCEHDLPRYVDGVVSLLHDSARRKMLREGALATAAGLSMTNMVSRFADGILQCLGL